MRRYPRVINILPRCEKEKVEALIKTA